MTAFTRSATETLTTTDVVKRNSGYTSGIIAKNPTAYWRLGDLTGPTATDYFGNYPGTYSSSVFLNQQNALGEPGASARFTGASSPPSAVTIPWNAALATAQFTLECWIFPTTSFQGVIFNAANGPANKGFYIEYITTGQIQFLIVDASFGATCNATGVLTTSAWNHIAATFNGTTMILYVNGSQVATTAYSTYTPSDGAGGALGALSIGDFDGAPYFVGNIQEVALYNYPLTAGQVAADYANRTVGTSSYHRTMIDSAVISEVVARQLNILRPINETVSTSDSAARTFKPIRKPAETLTTTDVMTDREGYLKPISEALSTIDLLARIYGGVRGVSESHTTSDSVTRSRTVPRLISETRTTTDALARLFSGHRSAVETHATADVLIRGSIHQARAIVEALTTADSPGRRITTFRSVNETHATSNSVSRGTQAARAFIEAYHTTESFARLIHVARTIAAETLTTSDSLVSHYGAPRLLVESLTTSDVLTQVAVALSIMGYIIVDPDTGDVVANLPDWGFVLVEDSIFGNSLYTATTPVRVVQPQTQK